MVLKLDVHIQEFSGNDKNSTLADYFLKKISLKRAGGCYIGHPLIWINVDTKERGSKKTDGGRLSETIYLAFL